MNNEEYIYSKVHSCITNDLFTHYSNITRTQGHPRSLVWRETLVSEMLVTEHYNNYQAIIICPQIYKQRKKISKLHISGSFF